MTLPRKHVIWIMMGSAVVGVAGLILYQLLKPKPPAAKPRRNITQQTQRISTVRSVYSEYYFDKEAELQRLISELPLQPQIEDLFLSSPILVRDEFVKYTREMRRRRRMIRKHNEKMYIQIVLSYYEDIEQLLQRSREQLLESLQIQDYEYEVMLDRYDVVEDVKQLHKKAEGVLMNHLITYAGSKRELKFVVLQQIVNQQINFMKTKMYERMRKKLEQEMQCDQEQILKVINALMEDIIYEKFGYQRQHIESKIVQTKFDTSERHQFRMIMEADICKCKLDQSFQYIDAKLQKTQTESINGNNSPVLQ